MLGAELRGVDLDARPAISIAMDELAHQAVLNPDPKRNRTMHAPAPIPFA
jgi:hypothetical protein